MRSSTAVRGRRRPRTSNRSRRTRNNETSCRELSKEERNITSSRSIALGPDFRAPRGSFPLGAASRHRRRPVPLPPWDIPAPSMAQSATKPAGHGRPLRTKVAFAISPAPPRPPRASACNSAASERGAPCRRTYSEPVRPCHRGGREQGARRGPVGLRREAGGVLFAAGGECVSFNGEWLVTTMHFSGPSTRCSVDWVRAIGRVASSVT